MRSFVAGVLFAVPVAAGATTFEVGPGKTFANIGDVPLESLVAGDTVLVYYRATPYREKLVIGGSGTQGAPIKISGVLGPNGERPILDGNGATTRAQLNYPSRGRGIIKIGYSNVPYAANPKWIVIENLEIRNAHTPYTYTAPNGATESYSANASAVFIEHGKHITIRNCDVHDNGNGLFAFSDDDLATQNLIIEKNYIHDNGNVGSLYEHNVYTEAIKITFQYNRFGPLMPGAGGNNLKDRSAGLTVRYNWIEGGNRQLDLVDAEDSALVRADPRYLATYVYGNVVIEHPNSGNNDIVLYGGDSGYKPNYRKGTLYFYNNTVYSDRTDSTRLFRTSGNGQHIDARNNIAYVTADGSYLKALDSYGHLTLTQNWFKTGWTQFNEADHTGTLTDNGTVTGTLPGFADAANQDFHLALGSQAIGAGTILDVTAPLPALEYLKHLSSVPRPAHPILDLGAFGF